MKRVSREKSVSGKEELRNVNINPLLNIHRCSEESILWP